MVKKFFLLLFLLPNIAFAALSPDETLFTKIFSDWNDAFNKKDLEGSCGLFSKKVTADFQGIPQKNYDNICDGFKTVFNQQNRKYHYTYKLNQVYRSGDLAAVRVTWYLTVFENEVKISSAEDEGLDVFEKNKEGKWQIVNYLGYAKKVAH